MKKLLIIASSFICASSFAQSNFFDGYIKACNQPASYTQFQKDLCSPVVTKDGAMTCKAGKVSLPSDMAGKLILNKNEGEFTMFEVKLDKPESFAGNQVVALEQWSGHENGIWGSALVLDAKSVQAANKNIKQSGVKFKKEKSEMAGNIGAQVVKGRDGRIRLMCDSSD